MNHHQSVGDGDGVSAEVGDDVEIVVGVTVVGDDAGIVVVVSVGNGVVFGVGDDVDIVVGATVILVLGW